MENRKYLTTFLLSTGLLTFILSVIPFGNPIMENITWLKILFYIITVLNSAVLLMIVIAGIICLFKDDYKLSPLIEFLTIISLALMLTLVIIFANVKGAVLSFRYVILTVLSFILVTLNKSILILRKKDELKNAFDVFKSEKTITIPELKTADEIRKENNENKMNVELKDSNSEFELAKENTEQEQTSLESDNQ